MRVRKNKNPPLPHDQPDNRPPVECVRQDGRGTEAIDRDVIRGRGFHPSDKLMPDGMSMVASLEFLCGKDKTLFSQLQGRTYTNLLSLFDRIAFAHAQQRARKHWTGDPASAEALLSNAAEKRKQQYLFRRIDELLAADMGAGYRFAATQHVLAETVLSAPTWAAIAMTCMVALNADSHYLSSIGADTQLAPLWKDAMLFCATDGAHQTILDELEWQRENARLNARQRDAAVEGLTTILATIDNVLQTQAEADTAYFHAISARRFTVAQLTAINTAFLKAYRYQHIATGIQNERFAITLESMLIDAQKNRIRTALTTIVGHEIWPP